MFPCFDTLRHTLTDRSAIISAKSGSGGFLSKAQKYVGVGEDTPLRRAFDWASVRPFFLLISYTLVLIASRYIAYQLRFDGNVPSPLDEQLARHWVWIIVSKLVLLAVFGQFSGLLSY